MDWIEWGVIKTLNNVYIVCKHSYPGSLARRRLIMYGLYELLKSLLQIKTQYGRCRFIGSLRAFLCVYRFRNAQMEEVPQLYKEMRNKCLGGRIDGKERRKYSRIQVTIPVDFADKEKICRGFARDMSVGGVFIVTNMASAVGQDLSISLSHNCFLKPLRVTGEIVRRGSDGIGLEFKTAYRERKKAIRSLTAGV